MLDDPLTTQHNCLLNMTMQKVDAKIDIEAVRCRRSKVKVKIDGEEVDDEEVDGEERLMVMRSEEVDNE